MKKFSTYSTKYT